ncbi:CaiB/BaiF CoA-transferase family protein [Mycolicibacterium sp. BiH015]|uniref:CaiB/BaiF CoA transferase family protein n=1 Tax=Mycolicibacterium sp. BiH015 TaxID=3018808 RepID=UPI0022E03779|nr:CaiB/BaiF CoA-transferase family protein [Mycolicibacterium sp. BiH015]MDA2893323.1 CaiB/BaiF CoA-transferase family protein [Mycolicibacterium sp. BiH015]
MTDNGTQQSAPPVFAGLKVVEIASFIAAPAAATMLSDFGADVVKVEPPGLGDPQRLLSSVPPSPSAPGNYSWHLANRNKRGMAIDLKSDGGAEILKRLVTWADVVITNFPHGTREALHLGYEQVSAWNPRVIYADITGYGDAGPDARLPGFDLTAYWSRSGLLASTRDAGAPPTSPPWGSGDYTTATAIYAAVVTGLYHRERTGEGANVGTSLLATGVWATGTLVSAALAGGKPYELHDHNKPVNAMTNPYQSADDRWLMLAAKQTAWPAVAKAIGRVDLLQDPRFADADAIGHHAADLAKALATEFRRNPLNHWKPLLDEARIPYGIVQTPEQAAADPQLRAAEIVVPIDGAPDVQYTVNNPLVLRGMTRVAARRAPEHGEHNDEVLRELGYSTEDIAAFREHKAIPSAREQESV